MTGIAVADGRFLDGLRMAGHAMFVRCNVRDDRGIWRFRSDNPSIEEYVALWGSAEIGDLILPHGVLLSTRPELQYDVTTPGFFSPDRHDAFVLLEISPTPTTYMFTLLAANGRSAPLAWFHLFKRTIVNSITF